MFFCQSQSQPVLAKSSSLTTLTRLSKPPWTRVLIWILSNHSVSNNCRCLNMAVNRNQLEIAAQMIQHFAKGSEKRLTQAENTIRNSIAQVRHDQDSLLNIFNELTPKSIPVISPAFRWAQSPTHVYLEVKFSTRFDSPACLDLFDHHYEIANVTSLAP